MRRLVVIAIILLLLIGGMFFFNGQADPLPLETIETPVATDAGSDGDA